jgi:hypothetical protein
VVATVIWIGCSIPCRRPVSSTKPTHPLDSRDRIVLEPEREREIEHRLGVGRPFDEAEVRVVDGVLQLALDELEVADELARRA